MFIINYKYISHNTMKITINNTDIELKQSFRTSMIYENIANETFTGSSMSNFILYFYCNVLGSDKNLILDFDDFIDYLDANPDKVKEYTEWLAKVNEIDDKLKNEEKTKKNKTTKKNTK